MNIPTEPIGSIPRPLWLIEAIAAAGDDEDPRLDPLYDKAIRDTVERFVATGSPVITDGEQRKYHNFWTYSVHAGIGIAPEFIAHVSRTLPSSGRLDRAQVWRPWIGILDREAAGRAAWWNGACDAKVLTAGTADEALVLVEKDKPHVLVSDIGMPDVDGFELLRRAPALGEARGGISTRHRSHRFRSHRGPDAGVACRLPGSHFQAGGTV